MPNKGVPRPRWTREEDEAIESNYPDMGACVEAVAALGNDRSEASVARRASTLGLPEGKANVPWTDEESEILASVYPSEGPNGVADALAKAGRVRSISSITSKANIMGVRRIDRGLEGRWTDEEVEIVKRVFPTSSTAKVREELLRHGYDRTREAINARAQILKIRRAPIKRKERVGKIKVVNVVLDTVLDKDVIEHLNGKRNRSEYVRNLVKADIESE